MCTRSARGCQHGHLCAELVREGVCLTSWNGCISLLGVVSAKRPVYAAWLPWVSLLTELEGGRTLRSLPTSWSMTMALMPHLRLHKMALHRPKTQGQSPRLAWCGGLE